MLDNVQRHAIWVELLGDAPEVAFHWRGDAKQGIERAKRDAKERGLEIVKLWAEEL
tara:strand:- start:170 stop:337 length:168 start_codon:yes stop_codon:yes gene_type:complete